MSSCLSLIIIHVSLKYMSFALKLKEGSNIKSALSKYNILLLLCLNQICITFYWLGCLLGLSYFYYFC